MDMKRTSIIVGIALGSLSTIWVLIQIAIWIFTPSVDLHADVKYGTFVLPEAIANEFVRIHSLGDTIITDPKVFFDNALSTIDSSENASAIRDEIAQRVDLFLTRYTPYELPKPFNRLESYWSVVIKNGESGMLKDVTITLPYATYVSITREDASRDEHACTEVITIGDLRATEIVTLVAWTDAAIVYFDFDKVRLTHATGVGDVSIYHPVSPFWSWWARNWTFLFGPAFVGLFYLVKYIIDQLTPVKKDKVVDEVIDETGDRRQEA